MGSDSLICIDCGALLDPVEDQIRTWSAWRHDPNFNGPVPIGSLHMYLPGWVPGYPF